MNKKKKKYKRLIYFFYEGKLHKSVHIQRGADLITAFRYHDGKLVKYVYSEVRKKGQKAFTTGEVGSMINRKNFAITKAIAEGKVAEPEMVYTMDERRKPVKYMWHEKTIMDLHEYFTTVHNGRPRKDGMITNGKNLPTAREVRARLRQGIVLGYMDDEGNFVTTWEADQIN